MIYKQLFEDDNYAAYELNPWMYNSFIGNLFSYAWINQGTWFKEWQTLQEVVARESQQPVLKLHSGKQDSLTSAEQSVNVSNGNDFP